MALSRRCLARAFLLFVPALAAAAPGLLGPTGVMLVPTAAMGKTLEVDAAWDRLDWERGSSESSQSFARLTLGLSRRASRAAEAAVARIDAIGPGEDLTLVSFKVRLPGAVSNGAAAVGVLLPLEGPFPTTFYAIVSASASRTFAAHYGFGAHLGADATDRTFYGSVDAGGEPDTLFFLFAAEKDLRRTKLNFEFDGDRFHFGANYFLSQRLSLNLFAFGRGEREEISGWRPRTGFGATMRF